MRSPRQNCVTVWRWVDRSWRGLEGAAGLARVWGRRRGWSPWEEVRGQGENGPSEYGRGEAIGWGEGEERAAEAQQQGVF